MVFPQLVDAARIDGPSKELIHLILRVEGLLSAAATSSNNRSLWCVLVSVCVCVCEGVGLCCDRQDDSELIWH